MNQQIREVIKRNKQIELYQQQNLFESLLRANADCGYDLEVIKEVCETIHLFLKRQPQETLPSSAIREMVATVLESRDMENLKRAYQTFHQQRMNLYSDVLVHNLDDHSPPSLFSKPRLLDALQRIWGISKSRSREFEHWIEEQIIRLKLMVVTNRLIWSLIENKCFSEGQRSNFALGQKIGFYQMDLEQNIFFAPKPPDQLALQLGQKILETFQEQDLLTPEAKEYLRNDHIRVLPRSPLKWVAGVIDQKEEISLLEYSESFSVWDMNYLGKPPETSHHILVLNPVLPLGVEGDYEIACYNSVLVSEYDTHLYFKPWPGHLVQETQIPLNSLKQILLLEDLNKRLDIASELQVKKWKFLNTLGASHQFNKKNTVYARWIHQPSYCSIRLLASLDEEVDMLQEILDLTLLKIRSLQDTCKLAYRAVLSLGETEVEFLPLEEKTDFSLVLKGFQDWEKQSQVPSWNWEQLQHFATLGVSRIRGKHELFSPILKSLYDAS